MAIYKIKEKFKFTFTGYTILPNKVGNEWDIKMKINNEELPINVSKFFEPQNGKFKIDLKVIEKDKYNDIGSNDDVLYVIEFTKNVVEKPINVLVREKHGNYAENTAEVTCTLQYSKT